LTYFFWGKFFRFPGNIYLVWVTLCRLGRRYFFGTAGRLGGDGGHITVLPPCAILSDLTLSEALALLCCSSGASIAAPHAGPGWEGKGFACSYSGHGELMATWWDGCQLGDLVNSRGDALF